MKVLIEIEIDNKEMSTYFDVRYALKQAFADLEDNFCDEPSTAHGGPITDVYGNVVGKFEVKA